MKSAKHVGLALLATGAVGFTIGGWAIRWWLGVCVLSTWMILAATVILIRAGCRWLVDDLPKMEQKVKKAREEAAQARSGGSVH